MTGASRELPFGDEAAGRLMLAPGVWLHAGDLRVQFSRSGGPGGQNINKVNTRVELWLPLALLRGLTPDAADRLRRMAGSRLTAADEIHIVCDRHRTQKANRAAALARLREMVARAMIAPRPRPPTRPTAAARRRRRLGKQRRSEIKAMRKRGAEGA